MQFRTGLLFSAAMIHISVKSMLEADIARFAREAGNQMPFATAKALTLSAKAGKEEIERQMPSLIDRPTPFTLRGLKLRPATKQRLEAKVEFRPGARDWLAPIVFGHPRKVKAFERSLQGTGLVPSGCYAVPGAAAKLDAYGNMSVAQIRRVATAIKGWQGPSKSKASRRVAATGRGQTYFAGRPGGGKLPMGIWEKTTFAHGSAIRPVIIFVSQATYRKQLDVPGIAHRVVLKRFPEELRAAVAHAIATRR